MYYLGQSVSVIIDVEEEKLLSGIFAGNDFTNPDMCWIAKMHKVNGEEDFDVFSFSYNEVKPIKQLAKNTRKYKSFPLTEVIYKGPLCSKKLEGQLSDAYMEKNKLRIIKELDKLDKVNCFLVF